MMMLFAEYFCLFIYFFQIFSLFSPNLVANHTPISSITHPMLILDPPSDQAASSRPSAVTPGARGVLLCGHPSC